MVDLLEAYSLSDILIFAVMLGLAIKGVVSFWDWVWDRIKKVTDKEYKSKSEQAALHKEIKGLDEDFEKFYAEKNRVDEGFARNEQQYKELKAQIDLLIHSDVVSIRCQITDKYHHFMEQKWIDDRSMMCLEDIYAIYSQEGGNHFIGGLMEELRALPKHAPDPEQ